MSEENGAGEEAREEEMGLEGRIHRLEQILARMESDDVALEEALKLFEEGIGHVRRAERILADTELRVEELLSADRTEPMELEES
ncbi:MAG: exodeoxyribonuclease VII small subunit [Gemmatimonadota bacterium]|nr:exodeoxyribonuclease VII small subunit [Gemmatimonadota bacterium]